MKFEELFLSILSEQPDPLDEPEMDDDGVWRDPNGNIVNNPNDRGGADHPQPQQVEPPKKVKPLSEIDKVKAKWKLEEPALTDASIDDAIDFFNRHKNGLRIYKNPGEDPNHVNLPEITALLARFPGMRPILTDISRLRDIQNYSWIEMEFFMDRLGGAIAEAAVMDFKLEGKTIELQKASAYKKWENPQNRIINENNLIVYKIGGKDESIALGRLQHMLKDEYHSYGNYWCVTNTGPDEPGNLYTTYRTYSSYYFVLNKNREENHQYYLSCINAIDPNGSSRHRGPYFLTPTQNGTQEGRTWNDIVAAIPQLEGKENLFKYFGPTNKEKVDVKIDRIVFRPGDPNDFSVQGHDIQKQYIDSGRLINDKTAFSVLPFPKDDNERNLRKKYIARTTIDDVKNRFKCSDSGDPLGILNIIEKETPGLYKYLDEFILKGQLHMTKGVWAIKSGLIGINYNIVFTDKNNGNITLYREKSGNRYGLLDIQTTTWIKQMEYVATTPVLLVRRTERGIEQYSLRRYANEYGDYFYFLINNRDLNPQSPNFAKGQYLDKDQGNDILGSNEYRKLGYK